MSKYLSQYIDASRLAMQVNLQNADSCKELINSLSAVRHALMCCVCGRLLNAPMGIEPTICHHYTCQACVGGKTRYMKGGCGWCKNVEDFVPNAHMSSVIRCFQQLCVYMNSILKHAPSKSNPEIDTLVAIVREVIGDNLESVCQPQVVETLHPTDVKANNANCKVTEVIESIATSSQLVVQLPHSRKRKRRPESPSAEPRRKRIKTSKHVRSDGDLKLKPNSSASKFNMHRAGLGLCFENGDLNGSLLNWSNQNAHDQIDDETPYLNSSYDPHLMLLENSVLAEHDYNKFTTVCDTSVNESTVETVTVTNSTKSSKRPMSTIRRPSSKKSATNKGANLRKSSLTIRQMSERDQLANPINVNKVTIVASSSNESSIVKPPVQRRPKSGTAKVKLGCRCAMATPAPGKLTCCGQRCPCYAAFHGCSVSCKCRGCRNPRGDPISPSSPVSTAVTLKVSSSNDLQSSLPLLFDATGAVFSTASREQPPPPQLVLHAHKSRLLSEPFMCFGSG